MQFGNYVDLKWNYLDLKISQTKMTPTPPHSLPPRIIIGSSSGTDPRRCLLNSTQHEIESFPKLGTELKMITKDCPCRLWKYYTTKVAVACFCIGVKLWRHIFLKRKSTMSDKFFLFYIYFFWRLIDLFYILTNFFTSQIEIKYA